MRWDALWGLVRGDFLERARGYQFLLTLAATVALGTLALPVDGSSYVVLSVGGYRGVYNSAWVGATVALLTATILALPGFYLVNTAIRRDRQTGLGHILASTSISKATYILSKFISNFLVLALLVGALAGVAGLMQIVRGEVLSVQLWPLLAPFLLIALPSAFVVAALAVLFESVRPLNGGLGNVLYFFVWLTLLSAPAVAEGGHWAFDVFGTGLLWQALSTAIPGAGGEFILIGDGGGAGRTFLWEGVDWTLSMAATRLLWIPVAVAIAVLAVALFDRFQNTVSTTRKAPAKTEPESTSSWEMGPQVTPAWMSRGPGVQLRFSPFAMVVPELKLLLKGISLWWYLGAAALIVIPLALPAATAQKLLALVWLWPVLVWSHMGTMESWHRTEDIVLTAGHTLGHQLPAAWLSGVLLTLGTASGVVVKLLLSQNWAVLTAVFVGALFIPSLALALGVATGNPKPFQILYTALWYVGPVSGAAPFDFMGTQAEAVQAGVPGYYFLLTMSLLVAATLARWRRAYPSNIGR